MLDYLDDLASDFSVFHRVDDIGEMPAAVFFRLAVRLPAYDGCMAAQLREEQAQQDQLRGQPAAARPDGYTPAGPDRPVEATLTALRSMPEFDGMFDITELPPA